MATSLMLYCLSVLIGLSGGVVIGMACRAFRDLGD